MIKPHTMPARRDEQISFARACAEGAVPGPMAGSDRNLLLRTSGVLQPRLVGAVLEVARDCGRGHSVTSMARVAGMSRASFAAHFTSSFQQTPMAFLRTVRLHVAAHLLSTTDLPVKVIGSRVGYVASSFSRRFRAQYGVGPAAYRTAGRNASGA